LKKYFLLFSITCFIQLGFSQSDFTEPDYIKSIILKPSALNTYAPIIKLGERINLSFDDLNADEHDYTYKIEHCNIDWKPSNLSESEFITRLC